MFARHLAMYLAVVEGGLSRTECGRLFNRDRRSVAYAVALVEQRRDDDPDLDKILERLAPRLHSALATHVTQQLCTRPHDLRTQPDFTT